MARTRAADLDYFAPLASQGVLPPCPSPLLGDTGGGGVSQLKSNPVLNTEVFCTSREDVAG